jgi:hypothetical protein
MEMLFADMMKTAHHRTGQQRPCIFATVGRDRASGVSNAMVDDFMGFADAAEHGIRPELVRLQIDLWNFQRLRSHFLNVSFFAFGTKVKKVSGTNSPIGSCHLMVPHLKFPWRPCAELPNTKIGHLILAPDLLAHRGKW